nr:MAG TPA: hypothetical protein [Caudoviricetes sp.]
MKFREEPPSGVLLFVLLVGWPGAACVSPGGRIEAF